MKNVWILERFIPTDETVKHIEELKQILAGADTEENRETANKLISNLENQLSEYPNGYWLGYVGKSNYKDFCWEAKNFMQRHEDDLLKTGIRAVKAQIEDNAKYWPGYVNPIINDGVTRYLYATYK